MPRNLPPLVANVRGSNPTIIVTIFNRRLKVVAGDLSEYSADYFRSEEKDGGMLIDFALPQDDLSFVMSDSFPMNLQSLGSERQVFISVL